MARFVNFRPEFSLVSCYKVYSWILGLSKIERWVSPAMLLAFTQKVRKPWVFSLIGGSTTRAWIGERGWDNRLILFLFVFWLIHLLFLYIERHTWSLIKISNPVSNPSTKGSNWLHMTNGQIDASKPSLTCLFTQKYLTFQSMAPYHNRFHS